jgi:hypothetical protein
LTPEQKAQLEQRRSASSEARAVQVARGTQPQTRAAVTLNPATADSARQASPPPANTDKDGRHATLAEELEQSPDTELARLARAGDESAFAEIVRRHGPRVFRTAGRFFRRREQVEEAAQEVFLKAFTQLDSYEGRGSFEGWLTRIATNTCLNLLRSAKRRPELSASDLSEDEGAWLENNLAGAAAERQQAVERGMVAADLAGARAWRRCRRTTGSC